VKKRDESVEPDMAEQVRFILNTGKRIHESMMLSHTRSMSMGLGRDISINQLHMLRLVRRFGGVGVKFLAEHLGVSAPSASAMVERLVEMGLLERRQSSEDRRQVVINLSAKAVKQLDGLEDSFRKRLAELAGRIGTENTHKWYQVMCEIAAVFDGDERGVDEKR
jgi:DNA-binding MarR family transcriptional regulator